jgi:hypothetical protein
MEAKKTRVRVGGGCQFGLGAMTRSPRDGWRIPSLCMRLMLRRALWFERLFKRKSMAAAAAECRMRRRLPCSARGEI